MAKIKIVQIVAAAYLATAVRNTQRYYFRSPCAPVQILARFALRVRRSMAKTRSYLGGIFAYSIIRRCANKKCIIALLQPLFCLQGGRFCLFSPPCGHFGNTRYRYKENILRAPKNAITSKVIKMLFFFRRSRSCKSALNFLPC